MISIYPIDYDTKNRRLVLFFSNYHQLVEGHNFHLFTAKVLRDNMHQGLTGYPVVVERFRLPCLWCAIACSINTLIRFNPTHNFVIFFFKLYERFYDYYRLTRYRISRIWNGRNLGVYFVRILFQISFLSLLSNFKNILVSSRGDFNFLGLRDS